MSGGDPNEGVLVVADAAAARERAEKLVGTVLADRYRIHGVIAMGGMGAVLAGEHVHMRKRVAIKVLHPATADFPGIVARFEREAIVGAHVEHRNIASARDFGRIDDGSYYLVLEFVRGATLRELVSRGPLPAGRSVRIARQVGAALAKLHGMGILHRDVNPRNVMVLPGARDTVKLIDFGFAKVPVERFDAKSTLEAARSPAAPPTARITADGVIFGTIGYLAPEAALGMRAVDARSDLYALGAMLYEMLAGRPPFEADSQLGLFVKHRLEPVPPIGAVAAGGQVPPALEAIAMRLLAKSPEARYQRADDVVRALDEVAALVAADPDPASAAPESLMLTVAGSEPSRPPPRFEDVAGPSVVPPAPRPEVAPEPELEPELEREREREREREPESELEPEQTARRSVIREQRRASWATRLAVGLVVLAGGLVAARSGPGRQLLAALQAAPSAPAGPPAAARAAPAGPTPLEQRSTAAPASATSTASSVPAEPEGAARPTRIDGLDARAWRHVVRRAPATRDFARAEQAIHALAELDPAALDDLELREATVDIGVNGGAAPDRGARLLEAIATRFGASGVDLLYDIMTRRGGSTAAAGATALLARADVRARGSAALRIAMDLRAAPCAEKLSLVDRARLEGDGRVLAVLSAARSLDCDPVSGACCLFEQPAVEIAVRELTERLRAR